MKSIFNVSIFILISLSSSYGATCNYVGDSLTLLKCEKCEGVKVCIGRVECKEDGDVGYADVICQATSSNQCPTADHCLNESNSGRGVSIYINEEPSMKFKLCDKSVEVNSNNPFDYQNRRICNQGKLIPYGKVGTLPTGAVGGNGATGGSHTGKPTEPGGAKGASSTGQGGGVGCGIGNCPSTGRSAKFKKQLNE